MSLQVAREIARALDVTSQSKIRAISKALDRLVRTTVQSPTVTGGLPLGNLEADLQTQLGFFNGTFLETFDATVASDGASITLSLEQSGGGDLTMVFSDGYTDLDCTPAATIALTAGSDTAPQQNFIYILESTKALTVSTSDWPAAEHIKVAFVLVRSAASEQTNGPLINQNWNDHAAGTDNQGHMAHMAERSRRLGAIYRDGIDETLTIGAGSPDPIDLALTAGTVFQMHPQAFPAFNTASGDNVYIVNHPTAAYKQTSDIEAEIQADALGATLANKYFNIVVWGSANKGAESFSPVFINLPTGSYNNISDVQNDVDGHDVYTIPDAFRLESTTGVLLYRYTLKYSSGVNAISLEATTDLRGLNQFNASGAGGDVSGFVDTTGTLLAAQIPFMADPTTIETASKLVYDKANAYMGIGIAAPEKPLHTALDGGSNQAYYDSHGVNRNSQVRLRSTEGTQASPSATQSGRVIGTLSANGYGTTKWPKATGTMQFVAMENYTDTAAGMDLLFRFAPIGSDAKQDVLRLSANTGATLTGDLKISQAGTAAAIPVLELEQLDVSEEMIEFKTTIGVGNAIEAIGAKTLTTTHFIKVTLPGGLTRYIPCGTIA